MKKTIWLLIVILAFSLFLPAQRIDVYKRPLRYERSHDYDAKHYRIKLSFDLDKKVFKGENRITLSPLKEDFDECVLDAEELVITSVLDENGHPLEFKHTDRFLVVSFPNPYGYGDTVTFTVKYQGHDPEYGLFFDDKRPTNPQMVSTVSWPEYAHHWFPCYDFPNDKVTNELIVTVKNDNKVLSNGKLVSVTENKEQGSTTFHWSQKLLHPTYLFMLAIGPFEVIKDSLGKLPINYWVYKKDVEDAKWIFKNTPRMIDFFSDLFAYKYPWAKYDQVTTPRQGGGAEATSATVLGEQVIHDKRAEQDFSWEKTIAHEAAHQWWGDLITLRTWAHTWLNESFGTYSDYLYTRYSLGEEEGAVDLLRKKNQYLREAHNKYIRPIVFNRYHRPQENFDSHTYPKGAVVLHMLRFIMGDKPFFRTLSYFLHKHEFQAVDTHDFQIAIKEATGQNLDWFFKQYIFKPGHPIFDISYTWIKKTGNIRLKVIQVQDTSQGIPIFRMPVKLGVTTAKNKFSKKVWLENKQEVFEFPLKEKPILVRFDEGNFLLKEWKFEKNLDELLYQLKNDDVIGRMWAASELIKYKERSGAVKALKDRALNDKFWAVRRNAVETLGKINKKEFAGLLKHKGRDENSKVRTAALKVLGDYRDPELVVFFRKKFEKESSYLVQAEALRSIGKCGDRSQLSFLQEAAEITSPRDVIRRAAEWAIEKIKSETLNLLRDYFHAGKFPG